MQQDGEYDRNEPNNLDASLNFKKRAPVTKQSSKNYEEKATESTSHSEIAVTPLWRSKDGEIRKGIEEIGVAQKSLEISRLVSQASREHTHEEPKNRNTKSDRDDANYELEADVLDEPSKVRKDTVTDMSDFPPPRRPMSAFLAFSNKRRAALKRKNPQATNSDLSKMLSKAWKELPELVRSRYIDEGRELREKYKCDMADWRKQVARSKKKELDEHNARRLQMNKLPDVQQSNTSRSEAARGNINASILSDRFGVNNVAGIFPFSRQAISHAATIPSSASITAEQATLQQGAVASVPFFDNISLAAGLHTQALSQNRALFDIINGSQSITNAQLRQQVYNTDVLQASSRENYLRNLANQLQASRNPFTLGSGRPTISEMSQEARNIVDNRVALLEYLNSRRQNDLLNFQQGRQR